MYDNITDKMVDTSIVVKLDEPPHNCYFGSFKVTYGIMHSDYCLIADKFSCNISQKSDSYISGAKLLCKKGPVLIKVALNQDKYFALLEFTSLSDKPTICIIIFSGINQSPHIESGINFTKSFVGDAASPTFFEDNFGKDKVLPRDPICTFNSKTVPCLV